MSKDGHQSWISKIIDGPPVGREPPPKHAIRDATNALLGRSKLELTEKQAKVVDKIERGKRMPKYKSGTDVVVVFQERGSAVETHRTYDSRGNIVSTETKQHVDYGNG